MTKYDMKNRAMRRAMVVMVLRIWIICTPSEFTRVSFIRRVV